ncbi:GNAT family N-acetyltransferase [Altererythrobacter sp. SALINAS58]|nr:GNAT family N-acetyltransferase [Alteripontixanthobacter muriae]
MLNAVGITQPLESAVSSWPHRRADAIAFAGDEVDAMHPALVIVHPGPHGQKVIGGIALRQDECGRTRMGCWIGKDHRRKGHATEAAGAMLNMAKMLGHSSVAFLHYHDDAASGGLLAKLGFEATGAIASPGGALSGQQSATLYEMNLATGRVARAA